MVEVQSSQYKRFAGKQILFYFGNLDTDERGNSEAYILEMRSEDVNCVQQALDRI
jgi:hypothetical protein